MGPYAFCLALGVTGLAVMAFLGFGHHGPDHGGHAGHHGGHHGGADPVHGEASLARLTTLLSPRLLFSVLVGVGAAGLIARPFLFEPLTALAALAGGVMFERWLVGPIWRFMFRFESRPALMLESMVMEEAEAMTDFDAKGQGLIRLGDVLRIEDVDAARNRCTVSFAGERPPEAFP
jgi:hypothetical protein